MFFDICSYRIANPYNTEGWDNISQPTGISLPLFNEVYPEGQGISNPLSLFNEVYPEGRESSSQ